MSQMTPPSFAGKTLPQLDAGVFEQKLDRAMRDVAHAVANPEIDGKKKGKVVIELTMQRQGEGHQVKVEHKIVSEAPTRRGKNIDHDMTETPLHVNPDGSLTVYPDNQLDMINTHEETHA